jgi:hypothetical protein
MILLGKSKELEIMSRVFTQKCIKAYMKRKKDSLKAKKSTNGVASKIIFKFKSSKMSSSKTKIKLSSICYQRRAKN